MNDNPTKEFYLNPIARIYFLATQLLKVLIAGRGFGKSFINGLSIARKVEQLPRSKGMFIGATYTQILTNTLLPMRSAWEWFGYYDGIHYVVGKKPPKHFKKPFHRPDRFSNVITFWNGTTIILGSFDRPQLLRGGSNDWVIVDEALLIKKPVYDQIIIPSLRGTHTALRGKPGHLSQEFTSSMPYGRLGSWLLDYELKAQKPENDMFYIEGTSWHNRKVLGDEVIKMWLRTMQPNIAAIEVMNKRTKILDNMFYPALTNQHWYTDSYNYTWIDNLGIDIDSSKRDSRWDKDCDPKLPLNLSHDWGSFNGMTIDQHHPTINTVKFINVMYVHHPDIIDDLAKNFCAYYSHHKNKTVYQWGDKSGSKREANARLTYFDQFAQILRKNGWRVIRKKVGDIEHLDRHRFIAQLHRGDEPKLPKIFHNLNTCKDLRIALESAPMLGDKKDKRSERSTSIKPEHATHLTDAYDYRLYHAFIDLTLDTAPPSEVSFGSR